MEVSVANRTPNELALANAQKIIATLREPCLVKSLWVRTANAVCNRNFLAAKGAAEHRSLNDLDNCQCNIACLRALLLHVLIRSHPEEDFEVEHAFPNVGGE